MVYRNGRNLGYGGYGDPSGIGGKEGVFKVIFQTVHLQISYI